MKVAIYVRVSKSDGSQNPERQIDELKKFCEKKKWNPTNIIIENVTGRRVKRQGTEKLINLAKSNKIQKVLVHEVSRIGRNTLDALKTVEALCDHKVSMYIYQQDQETLDKNYKKTPYALIVLPLLAGLAEQWTIDHSFRIKSGLEHAKKKGVRLGRPSDLPIKNEKKIFKYLKEGHSIRETERLAQVSRTTVIKVKRKFEEDLKFRQLGF